MPFQAVIFDLDGTLLNSLEDIANTANEILGRFDLPTHSPDACREFVGDGVAVFFERAIPQARITPELIEQCSRLFPDVYARQQNRGTRPYDGIPELLDALSKRSVPLGVLSNKPHVATVPCVEQVLGAWKFAAVLGQSDERPRKPDPAGAIEISHRMQIDPERIAYVGDTGVDMQTASSAGMQAVGALWGFRTRSELEDAGAVSVIAHPSELLDL